MASGRANIAVRTSAVVAALLCARGALAQIGPAPEAGSPAVASGARVHEVARGSTRAETASESRALGVPSTRATGAAAQGASARDGDPLPSRATPGSFDRSAWSSMGPLLLVVTLIVALGALVRRVARRGGGLAMAMGAGGRAPSGVVEVLARYPAGRGSIIVLMRVDRRVLVLHQSSSRREGARLSVLSELADAEDVASILLKTRDEAGESIARSFDRALGRASGRHAQREQRDEHEPADPRADRRTAARAPLTNTGSASSLPARPVTPMGSGGGTRPGADAMRARLEQMRAGARA